MRLIRLLIVLPALAVAQNQQRPAANATLQVWERPVMEGVLYRMEVNPSIPWVLHGLRFAKGAPGISLRPEMAMLQVLGENPSRGRETLSATAARTGALAGANGDFFPWTADPLGAMVRESLLVSTPYRDRPVFGWGPGWSGSAFLTYTGSLEAAGMEPLTINGINEECGENSVILFTPAAARAMASVDAVHAVIELDQPLRPISTLTGVFRHFTADTRVLQVRPGQVIVTATGNRIPQLLRLDRGAEVTLNVRVEGVDWEATRNAIGGSHVLIQNGAVNQDWARGGSSPAFFQNRHPRTAIGRTAEGHIWLVVVDGRQPMAAGASLPELAQAMLRLGCVDAVNLDGGGSSTLFFGGLILNRPSDGTERAIANSVMVYQAIPETEVEAPAPTPTPVVDFTFTAPPALRVGQSAQIRATLRDGTPIPMDAVLWAAMGGAWIDQSGTLRAITAGPYTVWAWHQGKVVSGRFQVLPAAGAPATPAPAPRR